MTLINVAKYFLIINLIKNISQRFLNDFDKNVANHFLIINLIKKTFRKIFIMTLIKHYEMFLNS